MPFPMKPAQFWPLLWGAVVAGLAVVLVLESQYGGSKAGEGPRPPAKAAEAKLLPAFRLAPDQLAGTQTLERPLFVPGRRPAPAAAEGGAGAIKKGQFVLQGTTVVGSLSIAMLKEVSTGEIHRVEKGGKIMGMTLAEISSEEVVLKAGDDSETLPLLVAKGAGNAAVAVQRGPFEPPATPSAASAGKAGPVAATGRTAVGGAPAPAQDRSTMPGALGSGAGAAALSGIPRAAAPGSPAMTPEEIISRRRAARRQIPQN